MFLKRICLQSLMLIVLMLSISCINKEKRKVQMEESGFVTIFNEKDLSGWEGDSTYWSVRNGVLVGEVTPETILQQNSFIVYQKEQPDDFELKLEYKISKSGNSGINYRSEYTGKMPFALKGYQCDIDGKNRYTGQNYEEKKRTTLAYVGERVIIQSMSDSVSAKNLRKNVKKNCWQTREIVSSLGDKPTLVSHINENDWNSVHLIVKDNHMQHYVNGVLMSEVTDLDTVNRTNNGYLGVQVHVGPPMMVEYKKIRLKKL